MSEVQPAHCSGNYRVIVCDDCGDQYAPELSGEVCACIDREGARHLKARLNAALAEDRARVASAGAWTTKEATG